MRASIEDSIAVQEIREGNYSIAVMEDGRLLPALVDPDLVFSYDTLLTRPVGFQKEKLTDLLHCDQMKENTVPCCLFAVERELEAGGSFSVFEVAGMAKSKERLREFADICVKKEYFAEKRRQSTALTDELCRVIHTRTGNPVFDASCEQTWLDNLLRGGYPVKLGKNHIFYLYSRKHGDIERDYNYFRMAPEYYSQGNSNFRDVNQNRRCDVLFHPYVEDRNIRTFYDLIQTDGYNPLLLQNPFTPGSLAEFLIENGDTKGDAKDGTKDDAKDDALEELTGRIMDEAEPLVNAEFGEGYWTDHFTYNLDLVEAYLRVYPDRKERLLYGDCSYTWFESGAAVNPRRQRYEETKRGIRQYHTLDTGIKEGVKHRMVRTRYGKGDIYRSTLMEKLLLLCAVKFATLDPCRMGIEMEGGKPGWYDALNGLPGLLDSSVCETCELCRMLRFVRKAQEETGRSAAVAEEIAVFSGRARPVSQAGTVGAGKKTAVLFPASARLSDRAGTDGGDGISGEHTGGLLAGRENGLYTERLYR